jgi:hypothetical protein
MSADTDDACIRVLGDFGRWQLRGILLMALVKVPAAWQMASILFTAPNTEEFWCARPSEFLNWDHQQWKEAVHPNTSAVSAVRHIYVPSRIPSSLALQPFNFCLGFPHDRCPFYSLQTSPSPFLTPIFLKSNSPSSIHLILGLPFYLFLPPSLPSSNSLLPLHHPFLLQVQPLQATHYNYIHNTGVLISLWPDLLP